MKILDYLKKFTIFDIIISILFIIINVLSIILFKWIGLLVLPVLTLLIAIYFNPDKIIILFKNIKKIIRKKVNNKNYSISKSKKKFVEQKKKKKNYSVEEEFEDADDIILKDEITDDIEKVYEVRDVDNVKKVNKKKKPKDKMSKNEETKF